MHALIRAVVDQANARTAKVAQINRFAILDHDFWLEDGEMTPNLKVKRQIIQATYAHLFDALYDRAGVSAGGALGRRC